MDQFRFLLGFYVVIFIFHRSSSVIIIGFNLFRAKELVSDTLFLTVDTVDYHAISS